MRYLLAAIPAVLLLAACGGDSDSDKAPDAGPTLTEAQQRQTATTKAFEQPSVPDKELPTPTPLPDDAVAVQVVGATGDPYLPKRSDLAALPSTEITVDGKKYSGVTLATLLEKVSAPATSVVTIDGARQDGKRQGIVRFPLADIGTTTVLVPGANGELNVASTSIPKDQWLIWVTGISIR